MQRVQFFQQYKKEQELGTLQNHKKYWLLLIIPLFIDL